MISIDGSANTITGLAVGGLPDASITAADLASGVAGTGPCFSAYLSAPQSISLATLTKLQANTEEFDTTGDYDNATNYRFTPLVAGYYQVNGDIYLGAASGITNGLCAIYKNGVRFKDGANSYPVSAPALAQVTVSAIVYLNGSTDYIELYGIVNGAGAATFGTASGGNVSYFQAVLMRAA